jgi:phenylpyruvate tautomerase PptA (4-oxalocrotonate tautomerase family)
MCIRLRPQMKQKLEEYPHRHAVRRRHYATLRMPNPPDTLKDSQKSAIAESISVRHSEATGAPRFFCQVVIEETPALRYLGGLA